MEGDKYYHTMDEIRKERIRQDIKWGRQDHSPEYWSIILMEEVGEACHELCGNFKNYNNYREEMIQVAAVAVAAIESYDRGKWRGKCAK